MPTCAVSAEPVYSRGQCFAASAENCGESETTTSPQISRNGSNDHGGNRNAAADTRQHDALASNEMSATFRSPICRDAQPPATHPTAPAEIAANVSSGTRAPQ